MGGAYLCGGDPGIVVTTLRGTAGWDAAGRRVAGGRGAGRLIGRCHGARGVDAAKGRMPGDHEGRDAVALGLVPGVGVIRTWDQFGADVAHATAVAARPRRHVVLLGLHTCTAAAWDGAAWHALGGEA